MPRDAVSRTAHVGTVGKNGLNVEQDKNGQEARKSPNYCTELLWSKMSQTFTAQIKTSDLAEMFVSVNLLDNLAPR